MQTHLLSVERVSKNFGATKALSDVSFTIDRGTIHSLLGRNGAGKSTVVNIVAGIHRQTSGKVLLDGQDLTPYSVFERQEMGVKIVPQHASIVPDLTVGENIFMGVWPRKKSGLVDWAALHREAEAELRRYNLPVGTRVKVGSLNGVDRRKVNIIRAMHGGAKLIILDEPTTALSSDERQELFVFVNELKARGTAFIFISHYLQEVVELSDEVTVIRDGMAFSGGDKGDFQEERLAHLIAGEEVKLSRRLAAKANRDTVVLSCRNLCGPILRDVSVDLYQGEITGVVGFPSSGARELCRTMFGLEKIHSGSILANGREITSAATPAEAMADGIAYLSYDRHKEGIVGLMPIVANISLPIMYSKLKKPSGLLDKKKSVEIAGYYFDLLNIKANSIFDLLSSLSGGNQQKVVYAKTLASEPSVLILDEPTIGIDIKSREEIIANIDKVAKERKTSVVYLTNDFDELIRIVDRMLFFQDGRLMRDVKNLNLTHEDVVRIRDEVKEQAKKEAAAAV